MDANLRPTLLCLSGLQGSGKTTRAHEWCAEDPAGRFRMNWDELRISMFGEDWKFNRPDEDRMQQESVQMVLYSINAGKSVVVDNTNLTERAKEKWKNIAIAAGANFVQEDVDTPVAECVRRDRARTGRARVGRAVIERAALTTGWIDWDDPIYPNQFVIVDMDGTWADCEHRRHHVIKTEDHPKKDWPAFFAGCPEDKVNQPVDQLVRMLHSMAYGILVVSGRPIDLCGKQTEDWLNQHKVPYLHLFMRNGGDNRDDTEVKQEILDHLPKRRIWGCIDDRDRICKMWRDNGLFCLQVAEGDF